MRRVAVLIALLAGCVTGSAQADPGKLGGMGANLFGNSFFRFAEPNLEKFPVAAISVGKLRVQLQRTRLAEVQRVFGGTIYQEDHGAGAAHWLCYEGPQATTWFMSNMLGGGEFVMMVATQAGPASGSCDRADVPVPQMGIPSLGASLADLKARFGSAVVGAHSAVSYRVDRPAKDGLGTASDAQYVGYMMRGGTVVGVGVGETTAQ